MISTLLSILFVYVFILLGYLARRIFKEEMNTRTLTLMSVYFLQPFVTVWGFSTARLHTEHIYVPLLYLAIILALLLPTILLGRLIFTDIKKRAIFSIAGFVGNTGNIGIPLGIAFFGEQSVIYTTLINIANVFVVYIIGVYIYSRGSFSIKASLFNIIKIPIIPASAVAILININNIPISAEIEEFHHCACSHCPYALADPPAPLRTGYHFHGDDDPAGRGQHQPGLTLRLPAQRCHCTYPAEYTALHSDAFCTGLYHKSLLFVIE